MTLLLGAVYKYVLLLLLFLIPPVVKVPGG